ncbi:MAG: hypothetical protein FD174_2516 [Geobacteraceae bacterium]|nr:MAG: hypothetical protein FD174_2516 [Geobacteraceae bacterium]
MYIVSLNTFMIINIPMKIDHDVCAIVVTYNPSLSKLEALINAILPQVQGVVVVDNGSHMDAVEWLQIQQREGRLSLLTLGENLGVAAGHNRGIAWAQQNKFTHVLLLDQDSIPADNMVERLLSALMDLQSQGISVSGVGPRYTDPVTGHSAWFNQFGPLKYRAVYCSGSETRYIPSEFLISSGTLIPFEALDAVGPMDDGLFIDLVDTEWFLRAGARGYRAFGVCDAVMYHSVGERLVKLWIGRWQHIPYHTPLRHYYYFRNAIMVARRDYVPFQWIMNESVQLAFMFVVFTLTAPPRLQQVRMMLKGVWDGIRGRAGKYTGNAG